MWVLELEVEGGQLRRPWLAPGSSYIIGRTSTSGNKNQSFLGINNKSVSRKHLVIEVSDCAPSLAKQLYTRSKVKLIDHSKLGSTIDGANHIKKGDEVTLTNDKHEIQIGSYEKMLVIKWIPVCFTLGSLSRAQKLENGMNDIYSRFGPYDIKIQTSFVSSVTTHVVASKRNVPPVLEGLAQGSFIVTDGYLEKLEQILGQCSEPTGCLLEQDFYANWPDEMQYVIPSGKEPVPRDASLLKPDPGRSTCLEKLIFVFLEENQFSNLLGPITVAGGKAILFEGFQLGVTKPQEVVSFVRKKSNEGTSRVAVIRLGAKPEHDAWIATFMQETDLQLGRRSVVQNEFLDAIIMKNTSNLYRPLEEEELPMSTAPETRSTRRSNRLQSQEPEPARTSARAATEVPSNAPDPSQVVPAMPATKKKKFQLGRIKSRGFNFSEIEAKVEPIAVDAADIPIEEEEVQSANLRSIREEAEPMEVEPLIEPNEPTSAQKRTAATELPAARAKKRRINHDEDNQPAIVELKPQREPGHLPQPKAIDVRGEIRKQQAAAEERRRQEEDILAEGLSAMDIENIRKNIKIEEMEILKPAERGINEREMDPRWRGRRNYKGFKRRGDGQAPLRGHRIIVPLEESTRSNASSHATDEQFFMGSGGIGGSVDDSIVRTAPDITEGVITFQDSDSEDEYRSQRYGRGAAAKKKNRPKPLTGQDAQEAIERAAGLVNEAATPTNARVPDSFVPGSVNQSATLRSEDPVGTLGSPITVGASVSVATSLGKRPADSLDSTRVRAPKRGRYKKKNEDGSGGSEDELRFKVRRKKR